MSKPENGPRDPRFTGFTKVPAKRIASLRTSFPGVPKDYLEFLEGVGHGTISSPQFQIYDGIAPPDEIFDAASARRLGTLWIFGDDFQGYCSAFDPANRCRVVTIDPTLMRADPVAVTFQEFLGRLLSRSGAK